MVDIFDVCVDILHVLSRITAVRKSLRNPSISTIIADFAVHDPSALLLLALLLLIIPGLITWAIIRRYNMQHINSRPAPKGAKARKTEGEDRHHSWLLGLAVQHVQSKEGKEGRKEGSRLVVTNVYSGGPSHRGVKVGDELLEIDGEDMSDKCNIPSLIAMIRSGGGHGRLSIAQRMAAALWPGNARGGRGSPVELTLLRRRDGRKKYKTITVVRGNWNGRYDAVLEPPPAAEALQAAASSAGGRRRGKRATESEAAIDEEVGHVHGDEDEDERVCRICQCSEEEAPEQGRLFSPCHCRGTMRCVAWNTL